MRATLTTTLGGLLLAALTSSCAFHSSAVRWNDRVGPDGVPVHYLATNKVAFNLLIMVPFLGRIGIDGMVDEVTEEIAEADGDYVRIVQGTSENYWYGFPPFTWIVTPVVTTLTAEYRPGREALIEAQMQDVLDEEDGVTEEEARARAEAEVDELLGGAPEPAPEAEPEPTE